MKTKKCRLTWQESGCEFSVVLCVCCSRSHKCQVHSVQDGPCQRRGFFGVRGEEVVDPPADRGERRERRRPHRHLENEAQHILQFFLQMSWEACWLTQVFFSLALPWSVTTMPFLVSFYPGSESMVGCACRLSTRHSLSSRFDTRRRFRTSGIGITFPLRFPLISFSMQAHMVLRQTATRKDMLHSTNQDAAALYVFYCSGVSCQLLKPVIMVARLH